MDPEPSTEDGRKTPSFSTFLTGRRAMLVLPVFLCVAIGAGYGHYTDPGPLIETDSFVIPHGNTQRVTKALQDDGVLSRTWASGAFFRVAAFITHRQGQLHAAEFAFPARASVARVLDILRHGRPVTHEMTIPEGLTAKRIEQILQRTPFLSGDIPVIAEGSVFPQTLFYVRGTTRAELVRRLQELMTTRLKGVWENRDQKALDGIVQTPADLLTLASLIERETSTESERPQVARVFLNRLGLGMRLQTDPSVIYGLSDGLGTLSAPLTHEELQQPGPYNTYQNTGLPPGPICSPSLASLQAAAHPASGKILYFVATGHGGHRFAETLDDQDRNIRSYHDTIGRPRR